eukprot:scaffold234672_cov29-Tisochrysis_lutea.AAC.2
MVGPKGGQRPDARGVQVTQGRHTPWPAFLVHQPSSARCPGTPPMAHPAHGAAEIAGGAAGWLMPLPNPLVSNPTTAVRPIETRRGGGAHGPWLTRGLHQD